MERLKDYIPHLRHQLALVNATLAYLPPADRISRPGLVQRKRELLGELALLGVDGNRPEGVEYTDHTPEH